MMKKLVGVALSGLLAASVLTVIPAGAAQAIPSGCSFSNSGTSFSSFCQQPTSVRSHNAKAKIYFNSGYSDMKYSKWAPVGAYSYSADYSGVGRVTDGPWIQVTY